MTKVNFLYKSILRSEEFNKRFASFVGGSVLEGFRFFIGSGERIVLLSHAPGENESILFTRSGAQVVETDADFATLSFDENGTDVDRIDSVYVVYTHGQTDGFLEYVVLKGKTDGTPADVPNPELFTFLGYVTVPAQLGSILPEHLEPVKTGFASFKVRDAAEFQDGAKFGTSGENTGSEFYGRLTVKSDHDRLSGSATAPFLSILDKGGLPYADFRENGDFYVGSVLKVLQNSGEWNGDFSVADMLSVTKGGTARVEIADDAVNIKAHLLVEGSTILGDDPAVDTLTVNGESSFTTPGTKTSSGASEKKVWSIVDRSASPVALAELRQNGDFYISDFLVKGAIGAGAEVSHFLVKNNLSVQGDTTLGNATTDSVTLNGSISVTHEIQMNNKSIKGLADPVNANDAVNKVYVDATAQGLDSKESVRAATTANITLSGLQTIDGVSLAAGDRVLVKNQTNAAQNGLYNAASGSWTRTTDADSDEKVTSGLYVFVESGTQYANTGWQMVTDGVSLGTTPLSFIQFCGAGTYLAGKGLALDGTTFSVTGTENRIVSSATGVDIAANYAGQTSITTVGTITTGTWDADIIPVNKGGTGAATIASARTNLNVPSRFATNIGNGSSTAITVSHNLNTSDVVTSIRSVSNNQAVFADWEVVDANSIRISFANAPALNAYRVVVVG